MDVLFEDLKAADRLSVTVRSFEEAALRSLEKEPDVLQKVHPQLFNKCNIPAKKLITPNQGNQGASHQKWTKRHGGFKLHFFER